MARRKIDDGLTGEKRARLKKREFLTEIKLDRGCESPDCGWTGEFTPEMLDFDHIDPTTKRGNMNLILTRNSWQALVDEVAKCRVLCANCHRAKTKAEDYYDG